MERAASLPDAIVKDLDGDPMDLLPAVESRRISSRPPRSMGRRRASEQSDIHMGEILGLIRDENVFTCDFLVPSPNATSIEIHQVWMQDDYIYAAT